VSFVLVGQFKERHRVTCYSLNAHTFPIMYPPLLSHEVGVYILFIIQINLLIIKLEKLIEPMLN